MIGDGDVLDNKPITGHWRRPYIMEERRLSKVKHKADGIIERFKAHLIAMGKGANYDKTFSLIAKMTNI